MTSVSKRNKNAKRNNNRRKRANNSRRGRSTRRGGARNITRRLRTKNNRFGNTSFAGIALGGRRAQTDPVIANEGKNTIRIDHTEYIQDIGASSEFATSNYALNPGNPMLFNWLSSVSLNFELYKFLKLEFLYRPKCSTAMPGTVITYVDYDSNDNPCASKQDAMTGSFTDSNVWAPHDHICNVSNLNRATKMKYVRNGEGISPVGDANLYDSGNVQFITQGGLGENAGEYHVRYSVLLTLPQAINDPERAYGYSAYGHYSTGLNVAGSVYSLFGTQPDAQLPSDFTTQQLGIVTPQASSNFLTFGLPSVYYIMYSVFHSSAITGLSMAFSSGHGTVLLQKTDGNTTRTTVWGFVSVEQPQALMSISTTVTVTATLQNADLVVFPMNYPQMVVAMTGPSKSKDIMNYLNDIKSPLFKRLANKGSRKLIKNRLTHKNLYTIEEDDDFISIEEPNIHEETKYTMLRQIDDELSSIDDSQIETDKTPCINELCEHRDCDLIRMRDNLKLMSDRLLGLRKN